MIVRFLPVPSNALSFPAAPFGRAVTVSGLSVLSTTWKSTDGTASHWKYVVDNVIVYRDVYRAGSRAVEGFRLSQLRMSCGLGRRIQDAYRLRVRISRAGSRHVLR